ncbi:MAG: TIGR02300 family protein [Pseudolabrys sp.]
MAKPDLGTKRVCPDTGRKFYDLNKTPVISPYTGKVVPIVAPAPPRARPEPAAAARPAPAAQTETVVPETADAEFVSLEDAEAEQQGKKPAAADATAAAGEEEEVEIGDESMDDAAFIEEQEEGDADVTDIIGESIEKEEET